MIECLALDASLTFCYFFFFQAEDGIRDRDVTGVQTCALPISYPPGLPVAKVSRIEQDAAYSFAKITCVPSAGTEQNRQVLVLSREMNLPAVPVETESVAGKPPKPKRSKIGRASCRERGEISGVED